MDNWKRELVNKYKNTNKEMKSSNFKSEILFHHKQIIEEIADHGIFDRETIWETKDTEPKEVSEGELININYESGFDKKDDDVPEEVILANNFNIKETLKYFVTLKAWRIKCWQLIET